MFRYPAFTFPDIGCRLSAPRYTVSGLLIFDYPTSESTRRISAAGFLLPDERSGFLISDNQDPRSACRFRSRILTSPPDIPAASHKKRFPQIQGFGACFPCGNLFLIDPWFLPSKGPAVTAGSVSMRQNRSRHHAKRPGGLLICRIPERSASSRFPRAFPASCRSCQLHVISGIFRPLPAAALSLPAIGLLQNPCRQPDQAQTGPPVIVRLGALRRLAALLPI